MDDGNAPEVPPDVTARIDAALRTAPHPAAHALVRPQLSHAQWVGLLVGACALSLAAVGGAHLLADDSPPAFPAGPTASQITVSAPAFPLSAEEVRAVLTARPDLGPLTDPRRRAACLAGLGYIPDVDVLGGRRLDVSARPAVLLVLPGHTPGAVDAVVVDAECDADTAAPLARTSLHR
ncbi:hypothetical protein ACAG24_000470 [Mycobacterium sp. pW049]|uniref:hypothetical protein n=1 Tax=[Mycobacterium] bulgaricum TaxID=3238985 RepID=UPI00351B78D5